MSTWLKQGALFTVAAMALAACGLLLYNFVANDWRVPDDPFALDFLDESEPDFERMERGELRTHMFNVIDVHTLVVSGGSADVRIEEGDVTQVTVEMLLYGEAIDSTRFIADARLDSATLRILGHPVDESRPGFQGRARITVTLPQHSPAIHARISLSEGNLLVAQFTGSVLAEIGTGNAIMSDIGRGRLSLKVEQGDISVTGCAVEGALATGDGTVTLEFNRGDFSVSATRGITADGHLGALFATTGGGDIVAQLLGNTPRCILTSDAGDIRLELLPAATATLDVEAPVGTIVNDLPVDLDTAALADPFPHRITSTMNGGGTPVAIRAARGDVLLAEYGRVNVPQ